MKYQLLHDQGGRRLSSNARLAFSTLLILSIQTQIQISDAFSSTILDNARHWPHSFLPLNSEVQSSNTVESWAQDDVDDTVNWPPELTGSLSGSKLNEFELKEHKPLGCSVEESLAHEPDGAKYVFVADVTKGGNAAMAGIKIGDVIMQLSGTFDEVVDVAGLGIDKIRSLVAGRPDESPLIIRVARGSAVMQRHELALVELCIIGDDAATAECITSIYEADDYDLADDGDMAMQCEEDDGTECMLDSLWNTWSDDLPSVANSETEEEEVKIEKKKKVAPWSSRSSGSGTYVRDPKTGKMVNIDE